jgi:cytochrome c oxidase subunit 4
MAIDAKVWDAEVRAAEIRATQDAPSERSSANPPQHASAPEIVRRPVYYRVFASLLILTGLTVGVAFTDLGLLNALIALAIAGSKALLVLLFFMHMRYSTHLVWVFVSAAVFCLGILLVLTMDGYLSRHWLPVAGW